jgi:hypothetical protein
VVVVMAVVHLVFHMMVVEALVVVEEAMAVVEVVEVVEDLDHLSLQCQPQLFPWHRLLLLIMHLL